MALVKSKTGPRIPTNRGANTFPGVRSTFGAQVSEQTIYRVEATDKTPAVALDPAAGTVTIKGTSIPENADGFFTPLFDRISSYAEAPATRTMIRVELDYFNSSSAKYLLDILKRLEDAHASGSSVVSMDWVHAEDDLDMQEAGQDYRDLLEFPVRLVVR